jgi:Uma2 family endonuclease
MTAALSDKPPVGGWTTDDLDNLPDDGVRRELLDGVLLVSPSPTDVHQIIAMRLGVALERTCPPEYQVTQGVEVRINRHRTFVPDVLVASDEAARRRGRIYGPHEVLLTVEIVSPTSQSMDRITKPALYAKAGIPFYWCIETDDKIIVHTYKIDPVHEVYVPAGTFTEVVETSEPWEMGITVSSLTPRYL